MSNDFLSQEDIDKLLLNLDGDGEEGGGGGGDERLGIIMSIFELFCKHAGSVLTTAAAKTVDLAAEPCVKADFAAVKERTGGDVLSISLPLASGVEGDMYLIMRKGDAATLANLMMGESGTAEYSPDSDDAICELFNQVMGAYCTALGGDLGETVSAGNAEVSPFDLDSPPFDGDSADMGLAKLKVEGLIDSGVALIVPASLGEEIVELKTPKPAGPKMEMGIGISQDEMDALTSMTSSGGFGGSSGGGDAFGGGGSAFGTTQFPPSSPIMQQPNPMLSGGHGGGGYSGPKENIDILLDVELEINIELGKSELTIKRILELAPGSIVELDKMVGEPVDLIVNNKVVARGEVVVVDENFGIRIVSLVSAEDRIKSLK